MYTLYSNTGQVVRHSDGKVVAPCQSISDPDYVEYVTWVNDGNEPLVQLDKIESQRMQWHLIRLERNRLLQASDYTQVLDYPMSDACRIAYQEYRQQLRDITTLEDADDVVWPELPTCL